MNVSVPILKTMGILSYIFRISNISDKFAVRRDRIYPSSTVLHTSLRYYTGDQVMTEMNTRQALFWFMAYGGGKYADRWICTGWVCGSHGDKWPAC